MGESDELPARRPAGDDDAVSANVGALDRMSRAEAEEGVRRGGRGAERVLAHEERGGGGSGGDRSSGREVDSKKKSAVPTKDPKEGLWGGGIEPALGRPRDDVDAKAKRAKEKRAEEKGIKAKRASQTAGGNEAARPEVVPSRELVAPIGIKKATTDAGTDGKPKRRGMKTTVAPPAPRPEVVAAQEPPPLSDGYDDAWYNSGGSPQTSALVDPAATQQHHSALPAPASGGSVDDGGAVVQHSVSSAPDPDPASGVAPVVDAAVDAGIAIVSARLVADDEYGNGGESELPLAVATRTGAVSIDLKDRRVRTFLGVLAIAIIAAIAVGVGVGIMRRGGGEAETVAVEKDAKADQGNDDVTARPSSPPTFPGPSEVPSGPPSNIPSSAPSPSPSHRPSYAPTQSPTFLDWVLAGPALYGEDFSRYGWSVSLSSSGSRLAVAAPSDPVILETLESIGATEGSTGSVSVCDLSGRGEAAGEGRTWTCEDVPSPGALKVLATLVSLSGDGMRLAVGYPRTSNSTRGIVQAYRYDPSRQRRRWRKLGEPIYGEMSDVRWGGTYQWNDEDGVVYEYDRDEEAQPVTSLSLSSDGMTIAVGSPKDTAGGLPEVRIFRYREDTALWKPLGGPILGVNENDFFGQSVSISADGQTVAIGAPRFQNDQQPDDYWDDDDGYYRESGSAAVYRYDSEGGEWGKLGQNLEGISLAAHPGNALWAYFGDSVSLSGNGTVVATAAPYRSSDDFCEGLVKVHVYSEARDEWDQHGQLLWQNGGYGDATDCNEILETDSNDSGYALSLSGNASRLAVGISSSHRNGYRSGAVHVFDFNGISWIQRGSIVVGRGEEVRAGWSVSLSSNGNRLAIGSPLDKEGGSNAEGQVQVYELDGIVGMPAPTVSPCGQGEMEVDFRLVTDVFGYETTWRMVDKTLSVVAMGGPYEGSFIQTDSLRKCLLIDCYKFSIFDAGDGIGGRGGYSLFVDGQEVPTSEKFEHREDIIFGSCTDTGIAFPDYCVDVDEPHRVGDGICDNEYNTEECGYDAGDCTSFNDRFPDCKVENPTFIGDGACDGGEYNTAVCGFDGSDCSDFNRAYPNCTVEYPRDIGDGRCDGFGYNVLECGWDGGDCDEFNSAYPNCTVDYPSDIGDGRCDGPEYNALECGWDGGDCDEFNNRYPNCTVDYPSYIGDGSCDKEYNTVECGWDGGDCDEFNKFPNCAVTDPDRIGDGFCHGGEYNTAECGFDGNDCADFNQAFPGCLVDTPSNIGDGYCNGHEYNTEECSWDGGDCDEFNSRFPDCKVDYPGRIGDGECDGGDYNTANCGFDGSDCSDFNQAYPDCKARYPQNMGDGNCDGLEHNTVECGWDGGDCDNFNKNWPGCLVENPGYLGDGWCDGGVYNTPECGFDGGDCQ